MHKAPRCDCHVQLIKHEFSKLDIVNNLTDFETFQGCMNKSKSHLIFGEILQIIYY